MKQVFLLSLVLLLYKTSSSQNTTRLSTDRPDQKDGANILEKGKIQFETEMYQNTFEKGRAAIISSSLLRYGLFKNFEVRLLAEEGRERDKFIDETTQGLYPLALSFKLALLKEHPFMPDIVLITYLKMPWTRRSSEDVYWSPAFILGLEKEINKFTLATNAGIKQSAFDETWNSQLSADIEYRAGKHVEIFTEYFASYANNKSPLHNADAGLLYYITNNWLIHLAYGSSVCAHECNRFVNTEFAFRFQ